MTSRYDESEPLDTRKIPERDDRGKDVVDANGRDIGMVTTVVGDTLYVDPNTRVSEEVERKLEWDDKRSTSLPVTSEKITRIDDEVVLMVEREAK